MELPEETDMLYKKSIRCPVWSSVNKKGEGKMYGILLESAQFYVRKDVGEEIWQKILAHAGLKNISFSTHNTYKDELMITLAKSCCHVTKTKDFNQWMTFFGTCFVEFCSSYGYDKLLRVAGRNYRDFLHGIDNIHEVIRFSYPRLQSPSFIVLSEDVDGCILLYRSKRHAFKYYVVGQLQQCAKKFYGVSVAITVVEEDSLDKMCSVTFRLDFDNSVYSSVADTVKNSGKTLFKSISGDTFFKVFPFCIVFNNQLTIKHVGTSLSALLKSVNIIGSNLRDKFRLRRPLIPCIWSKILQFQRVIFELEYIHSNDQSDLDLDTHSGLQRSLHDETTSGSHKSVEERILLRGQMKYLEEWDMIAFLSTPLINDLNNLRKIGLYINDLNMFDMSRDMVLAGWQHSSKLERSIEQQREKSDKITETMTKAEEWKNISDNLLYSMIPKCIAERLKAGENPIDTCEVFDNVTIMFNYMVGFADICASATPMEIVKCINGYFILFDNIVDKYDVFKVETLGDPVYMVAGGVPDRNPNHAINVAGLALELQAEAKTLMDPFGKDHLKTRIGMHTGSTVGGVVGKRMPQYCLFGDTVNTASRMQTYSQPGRIHLSEPCNQCLKNSGFVTLLRGKVNIKVNVLCRGFMAIDRFHPERGAERHLASLPLIFSKLFLTLYHIEPQGKGEMQTYWLAGKEGEESTRQMVEEVRKERCAALLKLSSQENVLDLHGMHSCTSEQQIYGSLLPALHPDGSGMRLSRSSASSLVNSPKFNEHYCFDNDGGGIVLTIQPDKNKEAARNDIVEDLEVTDVIDDVKDLNGASSVDKGPKSVELGGSVHHIDAAATGVNKVNIDKSVHKHTPKSYETADSVEKSPTANHELGVNRNKNCIHKKQVQAFKSFPLEKFILDEADQELNRSRPKTKTADVLHSKTQISKSIINTQFSHIDESKNAQSHSASPIRCGKDARDSKISMNLQENLCPFLSCLSSNSENDSHVVSSGRQSHSAQLLAGTKQALGKEEMACLTEIRSTARTPHKPSETELQAGDNLCIQRKCSDKKVEQLKCRADLDKHNSDKLTSTSKKSRESDDKFQSANPASQVIAPMDKQITKPLSITKNETQLAKSGLAIETSRNDGMGLKKSEKGIKKETEVLEEQAAREESRNKYIAESDGRDQSQSHTVGVQADQKVTDTSSLKNAEKQIKVQTGAAYDYQSTISWPVEVADSGHHTKPLGRQRLCSVPELKTYEELIGSMKEHQNALAAANSSAYGMKRIQTAHMSLGWNQSDLTNGDAEADDFSPPHCPFQSSSFDSRVGYFQGVYRRAHSFFSETFVRQTDSSDESSTKDNNVSHDPDKCACKDSCQHEAKDDVAPTNFPPSSTMNGDFQEDSCEGEPVIFDLPDT